MLNAIVFYRFANFLYKSHIPFIPRVVKLFIFLLYNCSIPYQCKIGKGTVFGYGGIGVVIHKDAVIGDYVTIGTNVTIGGRSGFAKVPVIGNNVYLSTGCVVIGPVCIGDQAIVGANAVVIDNVLSGEVVGGVPAKPLRKRV